MPSLLMIVPSRGRPANLDGLVQAWRETTSGDADLVVALDDDDPQLYQYNAHRVAMVAVGPRQSFVEWTNEIAVGNTDRYRFVGTMGDDHRPRTPRWDELLCSSLDSIGSGVAYGDDRASLPVVPSAAIVSSDIVARLGFLLPPVLAHHNSEAFLQALGADLGRAVFVPEVVVEHVHYTTGRASIDHTYLERANDIDADREHYHAFMAEEWPKLLGELAAGLGIAGTPDGSATSGDARAIPGARTTPRPRHGPHELSPT